MPSFEREPRSSGIRKTSGMRAPSFFLFAQWFAARKINDGLRDSCGVVLNW